VSNTLRGVLDHSYLFLMVIFLPRENNGPDGGGGQSQNSNGEYRSPHPFSPANEGFALDDDNWDMEDLLDDECVLRQRSLPELLVIVPAIIHPLFQSPLHGCYAQCRLELPWRVLTQRLKALNKEREIVCFGCPPNEAG
jgi:hypothetical protein